MRFTIRDLLWLMVVVALGVGWVMDHRRQAVAVQYYTEQYSYWRERVSLLDNYLTELGFEIKRGEDFSTSYVPPPNLVPQD
jgi:hypothetical protein